MTRGQQTMQEIKVPVPVDEYVEIVAERAAKKALAEFYRDREQTCPLRRKLIGIVIGISIAAGVAGNEIFSAFRKLF